MVHAVLNRMKCQAKQRAQERTGEAIANARRVDQEGTERYH